MNKLFRSDRPASANSLALIRIFRTWWPLALSWVLMNSAMPLVSAFVARLQDPEINLASYGGVISPTVSMMTAPTIMLLSTANTLVRDRLSYERIRRYMYGIIGVMTVIHALVAFTPLYYIIVRDIIGAPEQIIEPARLGLMIEIPWAWAIGYRRFNQGIMIRFGHAKEIWYGTAIRLVSLMIVLIVGFSLGTVPGVLMAAMAQTAGVVTEAIYAGVRARPIRRGALHYAKQEEEINFRTFSAFYIPLVITAFISNIWSPIGATALSRLPNPITSLAVWPVITGLVYPLSSGGMAFNEVVVALMEKKGSYKPLKQFSRVLAIGIGAIMLLVAATPLGYLWFRYVAALSIDLAEVARTCLWFFLPYPAIKVLSSWYQGAVMHGRATRGITESVALSLSSYIIFLVIGVASGKFLGVFITAAGMTFANIVQAAWLGYRSRPVMQSVKQRDELFTAGSSLQAD